MKSGALFCYTNSRNEDIYLYTLRNSQTEVLISNYGAIINTYRVLCGGVATDIVLGFDRMEEYLGPEYLKQYPWFGCAVGRYANRIRDAAFELDGKKYFVTKNRGRHQLHGGAEGFDKKVWKFRDAGEGDVPFLELSYRSAHGEEGFPGNLEVLIRFELREPHELSYEFSATADQPTPVNLTHHGYFNLNNGEGTIHGHELFIPASSYLQQDEDLVATGSYVPVNGTAHDFRNSKQIGEALQQLPEFDQSFVLDKESVETELQVAAKLDSPHSRLSLTVMTTEPVVHFYSGKWTPRVAGKRGQPYGPFSGLCLETHIHANAVNIPHFPNTVLRPGETYRQKTTYRVLPL